MALSAGRIVAVALAFWALVVVMPDAHRLVQPMGTIGMTADNDGMITVAGPPASDAGIVTGDRLALGELNCARHWNRCRDTMAVFGGMGGTQYVLKPGISVTLPVIRHGASQPVDVRLVAGTYEMTLWDRVWLAADEAGAAIFIALAFALVWKRPGIATWGFFLYAVWFNPGQYFYFYAYLQQWPAAELAQEFAQAVAQAFGYAGFVQFALCFPNNEPGVFWRPLRAWVLPSLVAVLALLQLASFANAFGVATEKITETSYVAGMLVDAFVIVALWRRSKKQNVVDRQRTRWVTAGCMLGLTMFVFADSNVATTLWEPIWNQTYFGHNVWSWLWRQDGGPSETVTGFFFLGNMLLVVAVFHAIRRHRVIDVSFVMSRALVLITIGLAWVLLGASAEHAFEKRLENLPFVAVIIGLGGFTMTVDKAKELLNDLTDRFFFPRLHEAQKRFALIGDAVMQADSFESIERLFVDEPIAALDLASAAVFRYTDGVFRRTISHGWDDSSSSQLPDDCTIVPELRALRGPLRTSPMSWSCVQVPQGIQLPVVAVPIGTDAKTLYAVALYGAHNTGDDLNADERKLLFEVAQKAALAYEHLRAKLLQAEVDRLKHELQVSTVHEDVAPSKN